MERGPTRSPGPTHMGEREGKYLVNRCYHAPIGRKTIMDRMNMITTPEIIGTLVRRTISSGLF